VKSAGGSTGAAGRDVEIKELRPAERTLTVMVKEFREFLLRGNLVDTAVGIVIGLAFAAVITAALVAGLITPLIAAIFGEPDFGRLTFTINGSHFLYGAFFNALLTFVLVALVLFFLVVKPVNALMARRKTETPVDEDTAKCPHCLSEIPAAARRCAFCTQEVAA
jgi:large conductance mechanosensitive channel